MFVMCLYSCRWHMHSVLWGHQIYLRGSTRINVKIIIKFKSQFSDLHALGARKPLSKWWLLLLQQLLLPTASSDLWKMWGLFSYGFQSKYTECCCCTRMIFSKDPKNQHTHQKSRSHAPHTGGHTHWLRWNKELQSEPIACWQHPHEELVPTIQLMAMGDHHHT